MNEDKPVRLRPRRPKRQDQNESKTWSRAFKSLIHVVRMTSKSNAAATASKRRSQARVTGHSTHRQRCAVRITYSGNRVSGQWAAHGRYLIRDSATRTEESRLPCGYDAFGQNIELPAKLRSWQTAGDPRLFKLIVSPEFGERLNMNQLVRDLMQRMEVDVDRKLQWAAVSHFNTEHPHAHVVLRGITEGQELRLDREYIRHGIRKLAEDICTEQLGFRTREDTLEAERREVDQLRLTSLDRQIARKKPSAAALIFQIDVDPSLRPNVVRRLFTLERLGLANRLDHSRWELQADFEVVLRTMQTTSDRQRMVAAHAEFLSDPRLPIQYTPEKQISELKGRVICHLFDDSTSKTQMVLEGIDGVVHIVPHSETLERVRSNGGMAPGHFVSLIRSNRGLSITDYGDAEQYIDPLRKSQPHGPGRPDDGHAAYGGWLGRYLSFAGRTSGNDPAQPPPLRTSKSDRPKTPESDRSR